MSGGSFNYLCYKDPSEMLSSSSMDDLRRMEEYLRENGKGDAADELYKYRLTLDTMYRRLTILHTRLEPLLYSAEWWASGDYGEESFDRRWAEFLEEA